MSQHPAAHAGDPARTVTSVLMVVLRLLPAGGIEECLSSLSIALQAAGVRTVVLVQRPLNPRNPYLHAMRAAGVDVRGVPGSAAVYKFARGPLIPLVTLLMRALVALQFGIAALRRRRGLVVHVHSAGYGEAWMVSAARRFGLATVYSEHGHGRLQGSHPAVQALSRASALTCHSRLAAASLQGVLLHGPAVEVAMSIVAAPSSWAPPGAARAETAVRLIYVGRVSSAKGVDLLIRALALAVGETPGVHLTVAGDGPSRDEFEALAAELGVAAHVTFSGRFAHEDLASVLEGAEVLVHPSLDEGLPHSVLEGMAYGKAIVATAVGGVPEVIRDGENGLLVPRRDVEALAAAIVRVVNDDVLRDRLAVAARESFLVSGHSVEGVTANTLDRYERCLASARGR